MADDNYTKRFLTSLATEIDKKEVAHVPQASLGLETPTSRLPGAVSIQTTPTPAEPETPAATPTQNYPATSASTPTQNYPATSASTPTQNYTSPPAPTPTPNFSAPVASAPVVPSTSNLENPEPATTSRPSHDEYFMEMAFLGRLRGTCERGKTGAVLVMDHRLVSTGYNGAAKGLQHCTTVGCNLKKIKHPDGTETEHCTRTIHAEQNAIIQAALFGVPISGATIYCTHSPCYTCAKMIVNAGIKEIVYENGYKDADAQAVLNDCNVKVRNFKRKKLL